MSGIKEAEKKKKSLRKTHSPKQKTLLDVPSQIMPQTGPLQPSIFSNHLPHLPFLSLLVDNLSYFRGNKSHQKKPPRLSTSPCFYYSPHFFQDDFQWNLTYVTNNADSTLVSSSYSGSNNNNNYGSHALHII